MDIEPQLPAPTGHQFGLVIFNGIVGSLFADYLWLYATLLTNSLISSLSMTLSIPMAMLADSIFRSQPPDWIQITASVPILISFVGAVLISEKAKRNTTNNLAEKVKTSIDNSALLNSTKNEREGLMSNLEDDEEEHQNIGV